MKVVGGRMLNHRRRIEQYGVGEYSLNVGLNVGRITCRLYMEQYKAGEG